MGVATTTCTILPPNRKRLLPYHQLGKSSYLVSRRCHRLAATMKVSSKQLPATMATTTSCTCRRCLCFQSLAVYRRRRGYVAHPYVCVPSGDAERGAGFAGQPAAMYRCHDICLVGCDTQHVGV